ncbi:hypothetical protein CLV78_102317 [Aliiruegeria haliotis]|uniref:Uncharacterized protein n=1 Tax=Aliiruegeria haliotis TaxID=1280846 RepID=A0A2T0RVG6_9RHOB|nr:hypothetical protein CLV78_102317 [Aliiruegeria haliotis]
MAALSRQPFLRLWSISPPDASSSCALPTADTDGTELPHEDLARLAALSPHLLSDVGFRRDPCRSTTFHTVWERQGRRIAVCATTGEVSPLS